MSNNNNEDKEFRNYLSGTRPKTSLYKTVSRHRPFSSDYELKVPSNFTDRSFASVSGSAFDYLARFLVARKAKLYKNQVTFDLKAYEGIKYFDSEHQKIYYKRYDEEIKTVIEFVNYLEGAGINEAIKAACFFARLEHSARTEWIPNDKTISYIENESKEITKDLLKLSIVFEKEFVGPIVRENSAIVYNPKFGDASKYLNGADADIYIDGVLYDFKTTKLFTARSLDETQMWRYFVFYKGSKIDNDDSCSLFFKDVKALALYKARFGEIEYLKIGDIKIGLIYAVSKKIVYMISLIKEGKSIDEAFELSKKRCIFNDFHNKM